MPDNVSKSYIAFNKARNDFIKLTQRTESTLKKGKRKLLRQLKRANTKLAKTKDRLMVAETRFAEKESVAKEKHVRKLKVQLKKEKQAAMELREAINPLVEKLKAISDHVVSALFYGRGLEKVDKEIDKYKKKKTAAAAKKTKKKSVKKTVKKKTVKKKAIKKKAAKKKAVRPSTKKKVVKKKAMKKKAMRKKAAKKRSTKKAIK